MPVKIYSFATWVSRQPHYPFDVILRKGPVYALVDTELTHPPEDTTKGNFYKRWSYGNDWHLAWVLGEGGPELLFDNFFATVAQEV